MVVELYAMGLSTAGISGYGSISIKILNSHWNGASLGIHLYKNSNYISTLGSTFTRAIICNGLTSNSTLKTTALNLSGTNHIILDHLVLFVKFWCNI